MPTEKVVQIRNGKKVNRERVYFPGYIMVEANLSGEVPITCVKGTKRTWREN